MAPKSHRPGPTGLPRTHSRSSSSGSSKAALNLHFTQKDPVLEKAKKAGHEVCPLAFFFPAVLSDPSAQSHSRNTSPLRRVNSTARVASREHLHAHRYAPPPAQRAKTKGFILAGPPADEDDDEWVSSGSGAVTPNNIDNGQTLVDQPRLDTPRAQPQSLSRVPTIRAPEAVVKISGPAARAPPAPPSGHMDLPPQTQLPFSELRVKEIRSATTSPVHRHHSSHKRLSVTRPPSTHSTTNRSEVPLRPHPLIRGNSFGQGVPMTPKMVPLAPLTVTSEVSPVSSPLRDQTENLSISPSSVKSYTQSAANRRTSVSSVRSVATLPSQPHIQTHFLGRAHDRHRTLSSMSSTSSSSVQALSSLACLPTTRPPTPQYYIVHFPPANISAGLEVVHPLLPPPYLGAHMSISTYRSPLKESYDRVIAARKLQKREAKMG